MTGRGAHDHARALAARRARGRRRGPGDEQGRPFRLAYRLSWLSSWQLRQARLVLGRPYPTQAGTRHSKPLIEITDRERRLLSFRNLIEVHVLSAIRKQHLVKLDAVRKAILLLRQRFGRAHPLADQEMQTDGKDLFVEKYGSLVNVSAQGQLTMKEVLGRYLKRIERDLKGIPIRL